CEEVGENDASIEVSTRIAQSRARQRPVALSRARAAGAVAHGQREAPLLLCIGTRDAGLPRRNGRCAAPLSQLISLSAPNITLLGAMG
ncbi:hypothetical protein HAX54_048793, partial [Datura stramonium]|nr:hypothetical protein [Datura stramonium]